MKLSFYTVLTKIPVATTILLFCFALISFLANAQAPVWTSGYPKAKPSFSEPVVNGYYKSNIKVSVKTAQPGTAYFVTYQSELETTQRPTAEKIVQLVRGTAQMEGIVRKDSITIAAANTEYAKVFNVPQNEAGYETYFVAANSGTPGPVKNVLTRIALKAKKLSYFYLEHLPPGYASNDDKYPLMIFLHGKGERGNTIESLSSVLVSGPLSEVVNKGKSLPFIIVSPQSPTATASWSIPQLENFYDELITAYPRIDLHRIYITGLSMGGIATWNFALKHPNRVTAIVPISGKGDTTATAACKLGDLPIWAFHDDPDGDVPSTGTKYMEAAINACPNYTGKMRVTLFQNKNPNGTSRAEHSIWYTAYSDNPSPNTSPSRVVVERPTPAPDGMTVYSWFLQYRRETPVNISPIAFAGEDKTVVLPATSTTLSGTGTDRDGTIVSYSWKQISGPSQSTIQRGWTANATAINLVEGTYVFKFTVKDDDGALKSDEITVTVLPEGSVEESITWNSFDITMQSNPVQQGIVLSNINSVQARMEFYESTNDFGVDKGTLFQVYNSGNHTNANGAASNYWANGVGDVYPFAGKSTQGRGSEAGEANAQPPTGVFDLQLHPPGSNKLTVCAFIVPSAGNYTVSGLGVRRVSANGGTVRYRVFNQNKTPLAVNLQATTNQDWVIDVSTYDLGTLAAGDRIYFATDRDGSFAFDFTEVSWTITSTSSAGARSASATADKNDVEVLNELPEKEINLYPNTVKNQIKVSGVGSEAEIKIYDFSGRPLIYQRLASVDGTLSIETANLKAGIYYMTIQSDGRLHQKKFLKE